MTVQPADLGTAVIGYVSQVLADVDAYEERKAAAVNALEERGYRILDGGDLGGGEWELVDWRTDELVASGSGGSDECDREAERLDPERRWIHIDNIYEHIPSNLPSEAVPPPILPTTLAHALRDWAENNERDARALVDLAPTADESTEPGTIKPAGAATLPPEAASAHNPT